MSAVLPAIPREPAALADRRVLAPLLVGALVGSLIAGRLATAGACLAVALCAAALAGGHSPSRSFWRTAVIGTLLAVGLNVVLTPGTPIDAGWPRVLGHTATREGAWLGVLLAMRMAGAVAAVHGLKTLWSGEQAADALALTLTPLQRVGAPIAEARMMFGLAVRFLPLLAGEWDRIARVQALRAGRTQRGMLGKLGRLRSIAVPALVGALERAERVALALDSRHYRVRPLVRSRVEAPLGVGGWLALGAGIALAALAAGWRR